MTIPLTSRQRILRTVSGQPVDRIPIWAPVTWHPLSPDAPPGDWKNDPNYLQIIEQVRKNCDFLVGFTIPEHTTFDTAGSSSLLKNSARREPYAGFFDRRFFLVPPENVSIREELQPNGYIHYIAKVKTPLGELRSIDSIIPGVDTTWEIEPLVKSVEDAEKLLSTPHRLEAPNFDRFFTARDLLGELGVAYNMISTPMVMVTHVVGMQRFMEWTLTERPLVDRLIQTAYERVAERLQFALQSDIGPLIRFGGSEQATPPFMSKRSFDEFIVKYEGRLWEMVRKAGKVVWVHCHGKAATVLDRFISGGVQMLDPVEPPPQGDMHIGLAKEQAAKAGMTLIGNIEMSELQTTTSGEIDKLVKLAICEGGRHHLILAATDFAISSIDDRMRENILSMIQAGLKYGSFE